MQCRCRPTSKLLAQSRVWCVTLGGPQRGRICSDGIPKVFRRQPRGSFHFRREHFAAVKADVNATSEDPVTVNDILLALCVCVVAMFETPSGPDAYGQGKAAPPFPFPFPWGRDHYGGCPWPGAASRSAWKWGPGGAAGCAVGCRSLRALLSCWDTGGGGGGFGARPLFPPP